MGSITRRNTSLFNLHLNIAIYSLSRKSASITERHGLSRCLSPTLFSFWAFSPLVLLGQQQISSRLPIPLLCLQYLVKPLQLPSKPPPVSPILRRTMCESVGVLELARGVRTAVFALVGNWLGNDGLCEAQRCQVVVKISASSRIHLDDYFAFIASL